MGFTVPILISSIFHKFVTESLFYNMLQFATFWVTLQHKYNNEV